MNAIFHLPEFIDCQEAYRRFFILRELCPDIFLPNTEIGSIYGNFRGCFWNGGAYSDEPCVLSAREIEKIIHFYNNELNIPLCFTFTNPVIKKEDCYDKYSNLIAEIGHNGKNIIRVSSLELEDYLRGKYPNYRYSSSVISTEKQPFGDLDKYDNVVIRRTYNNDWERLNNIKKESRGKIEFVCDEPCPADCPRIYEHYKAFGEYTKDFFRAPSKDLLCTNCDFTKIVFPRYYAQVNRWYISRDSIEKEYLPRGYHHFKITGRWHDMGLLYAILNYLIKPEFSFDVIYKCFFCSTRDFDRMIDLLYNIEKGKEQDK